jgi:hypothetical protein
MISDTLREAAEVLVEQVETRTWHKLEPRMKKLAEDLEILAVQLDLVAEEDERELGELASK